MIELRDVKKHYGDVEALCGISTTISRGEIVGLLGPNGAGKTTAMKILVGYLLPSSGSAEVAGFDVIENPLAVQQRIGYLPENAPVYGEMLVEEYLRFIADMRGLGGADGDKRLLRAAHDCAIDRVLRRNVGQLSKGFRQRVGLAAAILHDPEILILDEPTTGLDPNQIVEVRDLIHEMGRTKTVILSTHILPEVEATCDRAVILIEGSIRADGKLDELTQSRTQVVRVAADDTGSARELFERLPGVSAVAIGDPTAEYPTYRLTLSTNVEIGEEISRVVNQRGWKLRELRRDDKTLEQVFRELTETGRGVAA